MRRRKNHAPVRRASGYDQNHLGYDDEVFSYGSGAGNRRQPSKPVCGWLLRPVVGPVTLREQKGGAYRATPAELRAMHARVKAFDWVHFGGAAGPLHRATKRDISAS
jgi:hypothetical protein